MTDWTVLGTALISGASGITGAALGYVAARHQANAELERLRAESMRPTGAPA
ncbi:MAG: hypothetical protein WBB74_09110 [Gaiellaceae bacterium]